MVSFERVFEVIDLPLDIEEKPGALVAAPRCAASWTSRMCPSATTPAAVPAREVERYGADGHVTAVLSGSKPRRTSARRCLRERRIRRDSGCTSAATESESCADAVPRSQARAGSPWRTSRFRVQPGPAGGAGRSQRRRQDHPHLPDPAPVRPHRGAHPARRARPARRDPRLAHRADRHGHPGDVPVPRHHPHQPALCPPGRHPGRAGGRRAGPPTSTTSSPSCPTATTPSSASAATA